jgi:hypothetical protein
MQLESQRPARLEAPPNWVPALASPGASVFRPWALNSPEALLKWLRLT